MAARRKRRDNPTPAQQRARRENLAKGKIAKGEVRNPTGVNGWTKARENIRAALAKESPNLMETALRLAKSGSSRELQLLLGPLLPAEKHEVEHTGEVVVRFARKGEKRAGQGGG